MMRAKICKKTDCRAKGAEQDISIFITVKGNNDGLSGVCNTCLYEARVRNTVDVLGNGHYVINHIKYKIGLHKLIFQWLGGEWIKSEMSRSELDNMVAKYAQA